MVIAAANGRDAISCVEPVRPHADRFRVGRPVVGPTGIIPDFQAIEVAQLGLHILPLPGFQEGVVD